jgi:thiamine pyrophosphate-dependent acetolactate synthase large subunit-like protein
MTAPTLERRAAVARLLRDRGDDLLVVSGLGSPSYDVMAAGDHPRNFYLWAAMGSAAMVGFGLATARPNDSVLVVTGDGEAMMGLGALATIAVMKPANLTICVLDNGHFGETGMQRSHTGHGVALDRMAAGAGFAWTGVVSDSAGLDALRARLSARTGPALAVTRVGAEPTPRVLPPRDGVHLKNRFRAALGFAPN